jgi:hypothetical protein
MLRRLFRVAAGAALGRAWARRSSIWLSVTLAIVLFRFVDQRTAKAVKSSKREST